MLTPFLQFTGLLDSAFSVLVASIRAKNGEFGT